MWHVVIKITHDKAGNEIKSFYVCFNGQDCKKRRSFEAAVNEVNELNFQLIVNKLRLGLGLVIDQEAAPDPAPGED